MTKPEPDIDPKDVQETRDEADAEFEATEDEIDEQVQSITEKVNKALDDDSS